MIDTEIKTRLQVKKNKHRKSSGICQLSYSSPSFFKEWRVGLNLEMGMVFAEFNIQSKSKRFSTPWILNPLSVTMRDEITFENESDWKIFEEECDIAFKYQIRKFPNKYKQQINDSLNDVELSKGRIKFTENTYKQIEFINSLINNN